MEAAWSAETSATQATYTIFEPLNRYEHLNDEIVYLRPVDVAWKMQQRGRICYEFLML